MDTPRLIKGRDYYVENGLYVFTALYLKERGYCCNSGCRHCPYKKTPVSTVKNGKASEPERRGS